MNKFCIPVALILCSFCCTLSLQAKVPESLARVKKEDMSPGAIMKRCNETFQITDGMTSI